MIRPRILFVTESSGLRSGIIAKGLLQESHRLGMELRWREYDSIWRDGRLAVTFDALVFWGKRSKLQDILRVAPRALPVISVISSTADLQVPTVVPDPALIANQIAEHLVAQGLTSFLFVGAAENPAAIVREQMFREALGRLGARFRYKFFDCPWEELFWGADSKSGRSFIKVLRNTVPPFGVFAVNDQTAVSCVDCIREAGLAIPREVAVVGVDDHPLYTTMLVPLTSVRIDFEEIGRVAVRGVEQQIRILRKAKSRRREHYLVGAELVVRQSSQTGLERDPRILEVIRHLEDHIHEPISLPDLARRFGISRSGLVNRFQRATGSPPIGFLIHLRMERAKQLLTETRLTIGEIGFQVGFEDQAYFCRAFRRRFQMTPSDFRKER